MQRDDNGFMDLPENIKLDEDEYIIYRYKGNHVKEHFVRFLFALLCIVIFLYTLFFGQNFEQQSAFVKACIIFFIFFCILLVYLLITNWIHKGLYLTNKHLISFNGNKFDLGSIYILDTSARQNKEFCVCNGWKNILEIKCAEDDIKLDIFIFYLVDISGNKSIFRFGSKELRAKAVMDNSVRFKLI